VDNLPENKYMTIHVNTVRTGGKATAAGGVFAGAQMRLIGEAGPEAVVPLNRSLSQVDPAVRELSAIAQGMRFASQQRPVAQRTIDVGGIQIITPTKDPGAVAQEMVNRLVAVGY
jgi:SLT domain-containing protein